MDSGKIIVAGSSSVTPVMEKLKEKHFELYKKEEQLKEQRNLDEIASIRFKTQTY